MTSNVSLAEQVACIDRELKLRRRAYPRWIGLGRMTQEKADTELRAMEAVLETVKGAEEKDRLI